MAAKPKPYPKSLGACADLLFAKRQKRLEADKAAAALKAEETALTEHIIASLPKGDEGAVGKTHKVTRTNKEIPQLVPEEAEKFFEYMAKNKAWDLVQRRLGEQAIMDRMMAQKPKKVKDPATGDVRLVYAPLPGTKMFTVVKLSLTKK